LTRLCRSDKCLFAVGIHDASVLPDICYFQERLAAVIGGELRLLPALLNAMATACLIAFFFVGV
jgi:hypothetical protein